MVCDTWVYQTFAELIVLNNTEFHELYMNECVVPIGMYYTWLVKRSINTELFLIQELSFIIIQHFHDDIFAKILIHGTLFSDSVEKTFDGSFAQEWNN